MNPRSKAREIALQVLYRYEADPPADPNQTLEEDIRRHFEHFKVPEAVRKFASDLVLGTLKSADALDELIQSHAKNSKLARMSTIDRNLLRMAAYEMSNYPDIPHSITLDEAIELGKQFGTSDSPSFVNGILDSVSKAITAGRS